jgi:chromosome partitioning protein
MKVITFLNEKGGVGKTTNSTNLAVGLALRGYRVLFFDATPQANATRALGLDKMPGAYDLLLRDANWGQVVQAVPQDVTGATTKLFAVPSNFDTSNIASHEDFNAMIVKRRLMELEDAFDFCVFDTMPNPSKLHEAIEFSTDYIIIPTKAAPFDVWEGVQDTIRHIERIRADVATVGLDVCEIIGIQVNEFRSQTAFQRLILDDLIETYGKRIVWHPIPQRQAIPDAQAMQRFLYNETSDYETTKYLWQFVDNALNQMGVEVNG